jgi:hypothetical protein
MLAYFAVSGLAIGAWAALAPRGFYDDFPGIGTRHWVSIDGPYNEHLVRDFGALNLALAAVAIVALVTLSRSLVVATAVAELVYGVPHLVYHLRHVDAMKGHDPLDGVGGVALGVVLAALLLVVEIPSRRPVAST